MDTVTAYHETGHAVAAVLVGAQVQLVTIEPERNELPDRYGETIIAWAHDQFDRRGLLEKQVIVALAGPIAEMVYTGDPFHPGLISNWAFDWKNAWRAASGLSPAATARLRLLEAACVELHSQFRGDLLWSHIATIADELEAHGTLEGDRVHQLLTDWNRLLRITIRDT